MSVRRKGRVGLLPGRQGMMRGIAGVLALGLLFPGGAAVAAPEVPTVDDAVVAESVDTAPVEAVVESNLDVVESEALDEAPETIATNEASVEPDAELQNDPVVGPLSEQIDTNASVSAAQIHTPEAGESGKRRHVNNPITVQIKVLEASKASQRRYINNRIVSQVQLCDTSCVPSGVP